MKRAVPTHLWGDHQGQAVEMVKVMPNGCWHFTGYIAPTGYGQIGRNIPAHRIAWEVANERPVPKGLHVDHQCHNTDPDCNDDNECLHRRCMNPDHLEAVTPQVNITRGKGFGGINARATHCAQGHELTQSNIYYRPDRFGRLCRICRYEAGRRSTEAHREEIRLQRRADRRIANPWDFAIREWAIDVGLPCSMNGPISKAVREAFAEAHGQRAA